MPRVTELVADLIRAEIEDIGRFAATVAHCFADEPGFNRDEFLARCRLIDEHKLNGNRQQRRWHQAATTTRPKEGSR